MKDDQYNTDCNWMRRALEAARQAAADGEVPVGAVVVAHGKLIAAAANARQWGLDPLGHAEIIAIRAAAQKLGSRYLNGCSLYVTLEPCAMCAGAIVLARVERLIYAAADPKAGACGSLYNIPQDARLNHQVEITRGLLADEASKLLSDFFKNQRAIGKK
ncbi:MAG: tRNA adenosine(34) deaminase TadA [Phycisphaerae bacterium]|nr:tRNA adenosine(34) deaminase TadA [Phycisphaerae bacterium]